MMGTQEVFAECISEFIRKGNEITILANMK